MVIIQFQSYLQMSVGSEWQSSSLVGGAQEDSSNDGGLVIVDDAHTLFPPGTLASFHGIALCVHLLHGKMLFINTLCFAKMTHHIHD